MNKTKLADEQIVRLLGRDGSLTSQQIADQLGVSAATVRRRLKRLIEKDLLHFVAVVDPADFGYPQFAIIVLKISPEKLESAIEKLNKQPEIKWLATTIGRFNIIAGVRFCSMDELSDFVTKTIPKVDGIQDSETFVHLQSKKRGHYLPLT